jgi:hypothetical protein
MGKLIAKLLIFLMPFFTLNMLIKTYDTYSDIDVLGDKFDYFTRHKDEYNAIFIGSSSFYRQIVPALFDKVLNAGGFSMKSFNFGVPGMHPPESYFVTKRILTMNPQKLEWVILELDDFYTHIGERNLHTRKSVYWHNLEHTIAVFGAILTSNGRTHMKITDLHNNFMLFCLNLTNAGRGPALLKLFLERCEHKRITKGSIGPCLDGYMPLENEKSPAFLKRRKMFIEQKNKYMEKVASVLKGNEIQHDFISDQINCFEMKALVTIIDYIKDKGARPIFLIPPRLFNIKKFLQLREKGTVPGLISFQDPNKFPMLYNAENRFDEYHLNDRTAQEFTKLFSDKFMELMTAHLNSSH